MYLYIPSKFLIRSQQALRASKPPLNITFHFSVIQAHFARRQKVWQMQCFPKLQLFTRTNSKKEKIPNQNPSIHPSINCLLLIWFEVTWRRGLASCPSYYEVTKPPKNVNILVQQRYFSSFPLDLLWIFQFTSWIIITVRISILWLNNAH